MDEANRECRVWMHHWTALRAWKMRGGFEEHRICASCGSILVRLLDSRGYQIQRRILYADGYLRTGQGRLTDTDRARLRLDVVRAHITGEAPSE